MNYTMYIVGAVLFILYMLLTIWNINNGAKPPNREDMGA
jgi:hypothetical protein